MKALERLEQLLDERDSKIEELELKIQEHEDLEGREWGWCRHASSKTNSNGLPVPRLEIRAKMIGEGWKNFVWEYSLIYRHFLKDFITVPLGNTTSQCSRGNPPIYEDGTPMLPLRDGAHIQSDSEQLKIPAFIVIECDPPVVTEMLTLIKKYKDLKGNYIHDNPKHH